METAQTHALICLLGTGTYAECRYAWEGTIAGPGRFAPLLEIELLSAQGMSCAEVHALFTDESARMHEEAFRAELVARYPEVSLASQLIPRGGSRREIEQVYQIVVDLVRGLPSEHAVVVDVTHGFRSLGLIVVSALRFAVMAPPRHIEAILYGAFEARDEGGVAPVFDLSTLLTLDGWAAAARDFARSYDTAGLAELIEQRRKEIKAKRSDVTNLEALGSALRSGLPLEAGIKASRLLHSGLTQRITSLAPPAKMVATQLEDVLRQLALTSGTNRKGDILLTPAELRRQEALIDNALAQRDLGRALRLAREYLINRVLHTRDCEQNWLKVYNRNRAANDLKSFARLASTSNQTWDAVRTIMEDRNALAHCGFDGDVVDLARAEEEFAERWRMIHNQPNEFFDIPFTRD